MEEMNKFFPSEINQNQQIPQSSNSSDLVTPSIASSTPPNIINQRNLQIRLISGWFFFVGVIFILGSLGLAINGIATAFLIGSSNDFAGLLMLVATASLFIGSIIVSFAYFRASKLISQLSKQGYRIAFFLFLMPIVFSVAFLFIYQLPGDIYLTLASLAINLLFLTLLFKNRALFINDQPSTALRFLIIGSIFLAAGLILNIYLLQIIKSELRTTTEESRAVIEKSQKSIESLEKKLGEINKTAITEWETYSKDLYGFSLEYPKGWFAKVIESGEVPKNRVVYVGFSEKPVASQYIYSGEEIFNADNYYFFLVVYKPMEASINYENFRGRRNKIGTEEFFPKISLGGVEGVGVGVFDFSVEKGEYLYELSLKTDLKTENESLTPISQHVLDSFKFTK